MALFKDYAPGDHYMRDDRTGRKYLASDMRQEWTGNWVHKDFFEERHPQDFLRGRKDDQTAKPSRPSGTDTFLEVGDVTVDDL
jgi:hypothetical protein